MPVSISIDLDEIYCYHAIWGIKNSDSPRLIYEKAIPRIISFFKELNIYDITLFTVGKDLDKQIGFPIIKECVSLNYEIASHTYSHPYNLIKLSKEEKIKEITLAQDKIEECTGYKPYGFRAPGYNITDDIINILKDTGHIYDSSIFPSYPYYMAKTFVIMMKKITHKPSRSIIGPVSQLFFKINKISIHKNGLVEIPISLIPFIRLPFIGTFLTLYGDILSNLITKTFFTNPDQFISFEFHGIDFLDLNDDPVLKQLSQYQADLKVPWSRKKEIFSKVIHTWKENGVKFMTGRQITEQKIGGQK